MCVKCSVTEHVSLTRRRSHQSLKAVQPLPGRERRCETAGVSYKPTVSREGRGQVVKLYRLLGAASQVTLVRRGSSPPHCTLARCCGSEYELDCSLFSLTGSTWQNIVIENYWFSSQKRQKDVLRLFFNVGDTKCFCHVFIKGVISASADFRRCYASSSIQESF